MFFEIKSATDQAVKKHWDLFIIFGVFSYISIFYNVAKPVIYMWDEAVYAGNALEMHQNNKLFPLYSDGKVSEYNVKPPLVIWLQYIAIKFGGINELSIRLPSIFASLATCFMVGLFAFRNFNIQVASIAVLSLLTIRGFASVHIVRSGDLDATLVMFITAYLLLFLQDLLLPFANRKKYYCLLGLLIFLAFLTKSIAGLMPLMGMLLVVLLFPENQKILREKYLYFSGIAVLLACISFYVLADLLNPGYFSLVWSSEFKRLTENVMPWHAQPFWFYFLNMVKHNFSPHIYLLPLMYFALKSHNRQVFLCSKYMLIMVMVYLAIISYPIVKLEWYDAPVYPVLVIGLSLGIYESLSSLKHIKEMRNTKTIIYLTVFFLLFPLFKLYKINSQTLPKDPLQNDGYAIRFLNINNPEIKHYKVLLYSKHYQHYDQANFYIKASNIERNKDIKLINQIGNITFGDTVLCSQPFMVDSLKSKFEVFTIKKIHESFLLSIGQQQNN